jgi:flavin-dependent thymidylate synthase
VTKDIQKWADSFMFEAEPSHAEDGPIAYVLSAPVDPLGGIAACAKMYKGEVVRDLRDVTNAEREEYLEQVQKTVLGMPLEAVNFHFMLEGVHRGITHQMVRQRTAAYAQESTRFAVKRDLKDATALPPSLQGTVSLAESIEREQAERIASGLPILDDISIEQVVRAASTDAQQRRFRWDDMVDAVSDGYNWLIDDGMPAEEARGIMPTNITTRLNYITNLRNFLTEMGKRLSDQAQFEWRQVAAAYAKALREYGRSNSYWTSITMHEYRTWDDHGKFGPILERGPLGSSIDIAEGVIPGLPETHLGTVRIRLSSQWQYDAIVESMRPIEFITGNIAFGANFDRPSRIRERIVAFVKCGIPSSEWTKGSELHSIPPIHPMEWLGDPNSARLEGGQEFDIFGNRVPIGTGWHWDDGFLINDGFETPVEARWPRDFTNGEEQAS